MDVKDIRIVDAIETDKPDFDFEKKIPEMLARLPKMDLRGIGKVDLVGYSRNPNEQDKTSRLWARDKGNPPYIEICVAKILETMPEDLKKDSEAIEVFTAFALYTSAGYNMLQFKHGVQKNRQDSVALGYAKKHLAEAYPGWKVEEGIPVKK